MTSRGYDSSGRRAQAQASRARVLATARELFIAGGYSATSVAQIAKAAGVSTPTVFAAFTSKANLLREATETALVGDAEPVRLAERPQMRRVYEAPSAAEVIVRLAEFAVDAAPRTYPIFAVAFAAADTDPQIADVLRTIDDQRFVGAGYLADALARHLEDGRARHAELRDVIWSLTSLHLYGQLVVQRGWPVRRYGDWLTQVLTASVLIRGGSMPQIVALSRDEVAELLDVRALLPALATAFRQLSAGVTSAPPRSAAATASGLLGTMAAFVPGTGLTVKLVSVFPGNHAAGLPSHQALIAVFDQDTGTPVALMDGTHITAVRTGAAAAVAADALARPDATVLAILGAGVQGRSHLEAFPHVRDFAEIRIASRNAEHAAALAARHPRARPVGSFAEAVRGADVVCCCTDAREPILMAAWLAAGVHVSSVGGSFGPELDPAIVAGGRVFVEWRGAVRNAPPAGAHELQGLDPADVTEIGEVLAGDAAGRTSPEDVTVYKSTGHAVEDAAAARLVLERARETGRGTPVSL